MYTTYTCVLSIYLPIFIKTWPNCCYGIACVAEDIYCYISHADCLGQTITVWRMCLGCRLPLTDPRHRYYMYEPYEDRSPSRPILGGVSQCCPFVHMDNSTAMYRYVGRQEDAVLLLNRTLHCSRMPSGSFHFSAAGFIPMLQGKKHLWFAAGVALWRLATQWHLLGYIAVDKPPR